MSRLPRLAHKGPITQAIYLHSYTPLKREWVNPLGANSEQHQCSPNNINTMSRDKVMRINKMITKEKMP